MINRKDYYFKKAKDEGFYARSAYKLIELNKKYNLIRPGDVILDLGCSPGSWTQVCLKLKAGRVTGIDIESAKVNDKRFEFINKNIEDANLSKIKDIDVVLSDLAPSTTGNLDAERSIELSEKAFKIAKKVLKKDGNFLCKVFQGKGFEEFAGDVRKKFKFFKISKPKASRKRSKEIYLIGKNFKK